MKKLSTILILSILGFQAPNHKTCLRDSQYIDEQIEGFGMGDLVKLLLKNIQESYRLVIIGR